MKKQLLNYTLIFGGLAAAACIAFFLGLYFTTPNPLSARRPDIGFNILFIFLAIYYYKKSHGGYLHFYEGVTIGTAVGLFSAVVTGLFLYLFVKFVDYQPFQTWIDDGIKLLFEQKTTFDAILSEDNFQRQVLSLKNAKPYQLFLDEIMFNAFCIIPITLFSIVLRRQRPES